MERDNRSRILVVDDEKNLRESIGEYLALEGFSCALAEDGPAALSLLGKSVFDAAVIDLRLPGMDGLELLTAITAEWPALPLVMMSAHGGIADAVEAMKRGAVDYLVKPFDPAELAVRLSRAVSARRLARVSEIGKRLSLGSWLGDSPAMRAVSVLVDKVAPLSSTVLITGESGTGKEVVAKEIHRRSSRADGPFVPVNVGALPESLIESELFGHEKGAFTGADSRRQGYFELASGGTLFLDELGEMPLSTQVKLLRVVQERIIMRVGGSRPLPVDVRIIAATNRDLEAAVREGRFREDLYFRLNVLRIALPPLRDRREDIAPLAEMFLSRFARETGKAVTGFSPDALAVLADYPYPGNIRELENAIERAVILSDGSLVRPDDLGFPARFALSANAPQVSDGSQVAEVRPEASAEPVSIRDAERAAIVASLARNENHRERTARELGITRRTLLTKMKDYGLIDG